MRDTLANRLAMLRKERKLNQIEVADATGLGRSFLSMLENGRKEPGLANLLAIADFYDVSVDYLLCRSASQVRATNYVAQDDDERALLDAWRDISEEDRGALRVALRNARAVSSRGAA